MWTEVFPLDVVRQNALQIYQIEANTWGDRDQPVSTNSILSPRLETPVYGVAIDPDSDFDHVDLVPSVKPTSPSPLPYVPSPLDRDRLPAAKDSLLAGRFSFPRIKNYDGGFFFQCLTPDTYGDDYMDVDGALKPFGRALNTISPATFVRPVLRVITYIDALTSPPSLPRRPPKNFTKIDTYPSAAIPFLVVPCYGRKLARVTALAKNPNTLKINGVTARPNAGLPGFPNMAFPLASLPLAANLISSIYLTDLACNFLVIHADVDAVDNLEVQIQVLD
jgi:hypothetical protein